MEQSITIREAAGAAETGLFWEQLHIYHSRDIFPDPENENLAYFLGDGYRTQIETLHQRPHDRCRYLLFFEGGRSIGFAMPVIYDSEDGKCFLMEFCVYPEYRGGGMGRRCAGVFLDWARENGAAYFELNCGDARRQRFWERLGFLRNGVDEWGEPLMLLPPREYIPFAVQRLSDPEDWQLLKLENGFLADIGEAVLDEEKQQRLQQALREGAITFFAARRGSRAVGMCSVGRCFSTFACGEVGVFDDFYIEPVFRKKGIARLLTQTAQAWCHSEGLASLTVCCAPCDVELYRALGFDIPLGRSLAKRI